MFNRFATMFVAGAAILALDASASSAQTKKPTSTKRIPITKEAPGEVVAPRVDTVTVYKTDTLRLQGRVDTVTTTTTMTRVDTVTQQINMAAPMHGGWYFGLGGGTNLPYGGIRTVNQPAATGQVELGYQPLNGALGFRGDAQFNQFSHTALYAAMGPRPKVFNASLDARLNLPIFNSFLGSAVRFTPYLLGGGSYVGYDNLRMQLEDGVPGGFGPNHAVIPGGTDSWQNKFGWNAGVGLAIHAGRKEIFGESRIIQWSQGNDGSQQFDTPRQIPIVFGVRFF